MIINVCVCVSSCDWRPFPTEPGLGRAGGRLNHRSSAGVRLASASTSVHSHPLITQTVPTHQLFTVTNVSALKHFSPHYRAELHLQKLLCIYFLTDVYSLMLVRVHVRARVLESSEHSGSQLRSSQQPSVAQLNPYTHTPHPLLQLCSWCQRDSCALQWAMFWVQEEGGRPRQQLPLSIYTISVIPASHLHLPWSDLDLCFTPFPLSPQPSLLSLSHFSFVPLATFN